MIFLCSLLVLHKKKEGRLLYRMAAMITPSSIKPCSPQGTNSRKQTSSSNKTTGELLSSQKRIPKTFPFLSKILDKLQPLQQNRHSATDQVKFLTASRQWTAHETEPNSQEVFSERQVSWCLIRMPYLRKEASLKMRVKMRRQQVTLNMRVKMRHFFMSK